MLGVFAPSFLCAWNQILWRNLQTRVLLCDILHVLLQLFNEYSEYEVVDQFLQNPF